MRKRGCGGSILTQRLPTRKTSTRPTQRSGHWSKAKFAAILAAGALTLLSPVSAVPIEPFKASMEEKQLAQIGSQETTEMLAQVDADLSVKSESLNQGLYMGQEEQNLLAQA